MESVAGCCRGYLFRQTYNIRSILQRRYVVQEIFDTEVTFLSSLNQVKQLFQLPLANSQNAERPILPRLLVRSLFLNIDEVITASCVNANIFQQQATSWYYDSRFGASMLRALRNMLPLVEYTLQWEYQKRALHQAYKNTLFKQFVQLQIAAESLGKLSLEDLLIMSVPR